jgi:hypothetical protein
MVYEITLTGVPLQPESLKLDPVNRQAQKGNLFPQSKEYVANLIFELRKPLIRESLDVMLTSMGDGLI